MSERTSFISKFKFIPIDNAPSIFFVSSSRVLEETVYIIDSSDTSKASTPTPDEEAVEETHTQSEKTLTEEILSCLGWQCII